LTSDVVIPACSLLVFFVVVGTSLARGLIDGYGVTDTFPSLLSSHLASWFPPLCIVSIVSCGGLLCNGSKRVGLRRSETFHLCCAMRHIMAVFIRRSLNNYQVITTKNTLANSDARKTKPWLSSQWSPAKAIKCPSEECPLKYFMFSPLILTSVMLLRPSVYDWKSWGHVRVILDPAVGTDNMWYYIYEKCITFTVVEMTKCNQAFTVSK